MSTTTSRPVMQTPGKVVWRPTLTDAQTEPGVAKPFAHEMLCLECAHAELYAEEPRARCTCADSVYSEKIVFAGQTACDRMKLRGDDELSLAWCSPGLKAGHARFVQPRPRAH